MPKKINRNQIFCFIFLIFNVLFVGCSPKIIPGGSTTTHIRDSIVLQIKDSVVITPVEIVKDVAAAYDTLQMETSLAKSRAWVDTTNHILRGEIANKKAVQKEIKTEVKWQTRDSIVYKEVPVPVEVAKTKHPAYEPWLWAWGVFALLVFGLLIYLFIRRKMRIL